jgi:hypothetical protein
MPKRSNEFQRIVFLIQRQLAGDATVTESKMLPNRDAGDFSEVDVVIETAIGGIPLTIGVECQGRGRSATVEWVQQAYGKHRSLPINKTVLVAEAGFSKRALKLARELKMEALSLSEAENQDWRSILDLSTANLELASLAFERRHLEITCLIPNDQVVDLKGAVVELGQGEVLTVEEYIAGLLGINTVMMAAHEYWTKNGTPASWPMTLCVAWPTDKPSPCLQIPDGRTFRMTRLDLQIQVRYARSKLSMKTGAYAGHAIAYGAVPHAFEEHKHIAENIILAMSQGKDGKPSATLLVPQSSGDPKVLDLEFGPEVSATRIVYDRQP